MQPRSRAAERSALHSATVLIGFLSIALLVAALGSAVSSPVIDGWYADTAKPMWNPPNAIFGPVWTVLYIAMSVAAWLVWRSPRTEARRRALSIYFAQLMINAIWSPAFFGLGSVIGAAGTWVSLLIIVVLDFLVLAAIIRFAEVSKPAAALLVPYWLWVLFATTLNAAIAVLAR